MDRAWDSGQPPESPRCVPPARFLLVVADVLLFYCEKDEEEVEKFRCDITDKMKDICPVVIHMRCDLAPEGRELQCTADMCKISVQRWFYITENAIQDKKMLFDIDEQIMSSLKDNNSFIPVWSKPKEHFAQLPYGLQAYTGLYTHDRRLIRRLRTMFDNDYHRGCKENLRKCQELEKQRWITVEQKLAEEKERLQKEHQQNITNMRTEDQPMPPQDSSLPETEDKLKLMRVSPPRSCGSNPDAAMPEYLSASLDDARSSISSHRSQSPTTVYNITINQPGNVNIGGSISVETDGIEEETSLKSKSAHDTR